MLRPTKRNLYILALGLSAVVLCGNHLERNTAQAQGSKEKVLSKSKIGLRQSSTLKPVRTRQASCAWHLYKIGLAIRSYTNDNSEKYPHGEDWVDALQPYLKNDSLFNCPALPNGQKYGYAYNNNLRGQSVPGIPYPSKTVSIYESRVLKRNTFGLGEKRAFRHKNGANYAFVDGHVKWLARGQKLNFKVWP